MFFYEKLSYKEIAQETRMNIAEVKSALQNGKRKLRLYLRNKLNPA
jgi:DNA-directed RNA polymerase specialized sigma24 family protein